MFLRIVSQQILFPELPGNQQFNHLRNELRDTIGSGRDSLRLPAADPEIESGPDDRDAEGFQGGAIFGGGHQSDSADLSNEMTMITAKTPMIR
jgi:hypothetical protein